SAAKRSAPARHGSDRTRRFESRRQWCTHLVGGGHSRGVPVCGDRHAAGALAGYFGGWLDHVVMRLVDIVLSVPLLLMVIVFVSVVGPGLLSVITVIGLLGWPGTARLVRGQFLSLRQEEFIVAARVVGAGVSRIVLQHLV